MRLEEVDFVTNLCYDELIKIAEAYTEKKNEPYEIDRKNILYDSNSYVTKEPVWRVYVISKSVKERWPDAYESLLISDRKGRLVYVQNDHGVIVEKF